MRNPEKLKAFELSDNLVLEIYKYTKNFPKEELYGLTSQIRRAAVSVPANIVEGCARPTEKDYVHFLNIAFSSLAEVGYFIKLSHKLEYLNKGEYNKLNNQFKESYRTLFGLIKSFQK